MGGREASEEAAAMVQAMAVAWMGLEMVRFWRYFGIEAKRTC